MFINCDDQSDELNCDETTRFYCENEKPLFVSIDKVSLKKKIESDFNEWYYHIDVTNMFCEKVIEDLHVCFFLSSKSVSDFHVLLFFNFNLLISIFSCTPKYLILCCIFIFPNGIGNVRFVNNQV